MEEFETCKEVSQYIGQNNIHDARMLLIRLLDSLGGKKPVHTELINHLLRLCGLYPYIDSDNASWQERFVCEAFKVNVGGKEAVLHLAQSEILKMLLEGESIAISAPTSFGKSFIIDAYIAIKQPVNVVIIVPTIALTDETRRRIFKKFGKTYNIITTSDVEIGVRNIFIFPQERSLNYVKKIDSIDILIIDEFYKASSTFDERASTLLLSLLKLGKKAKQKYLLAPNISSIKENVFLDGIRFISKLDFNTVVLNEHHEYKTIKGVSEKESRLVSLIKKSKSKSLIYAASYSEINKVSDIVGRNFDDTDFTLLGEFASWLESNYGDNWVLPSLIRKGFGIHNGQLHRCVSQLQIKLFEEAKGIDNLISTSSLIEGVNTSAKNVFIWRARMSGSFRKLDSFTYKNIIGRGGRMFKYFVGDVYLLESPPSVTETQLELPFPDELLGGIDLVEDAISLSDKQVFTLKELKSSMDKLMGENKFSILHSQNAFTSTDFDLFKKMATDLKNNPYSWNGIGILNSNSFTAWVPFLRKILFFTPKIWSIFGRGDSDQVRKFVICIITLTKNWTFSTKEIIADLNSLGIDVSTFFKLERLITFNLASLLSDFNILQKAILPQTVDIAPFISRVSSAFLPPVVYQLEEFGLPRSIARKIHEKQLLNFEQEGLKLKDCISQFQNYGLDYFTTKDYFSSFEIYILEHFFDGITTSE